jgi:hypothetical protein
MMLECGMDAHIPEQTDELPTQEELTTNSCGMLGQFV